VERYGVKCGGDEKKELLVESRVLIHETSFVGVESRVLIPETTFVDVESRDLDTFITDVISLALSKVVATFSKRREEEISRPHSKALNKPCDSYVHNVSQYTPTHEFGHGSGSNEMTENHFKALGSLRNFRDDW
nr:DOF zinc finger protein DOF3.4 [Tanacetum cinerariifolium]